MKATKIIALAVIVTTVLFACKKENVNPATTTSSANSGAMKVKMTDAPGDFAKLDVQISAVEVYSDLDGWITLNNNAQTVSVLDLSNGVTTDLAYNTQLNAGHYSKVKLVFGDQNTLETHVAAQLNGTGMTSSNTFVLGWIGSKEVEIAIDVNVNASAETEVLLDFDAANSVKQQLNEYVITPAITFAHDLETGLQGSIQTGANAAVVLTGPMGQSSTYANAFGNFSFTGLKPGQYLMEIYPTAEEVLAGAQNKITIGTVTVVSGEIHQMGSIAITN